MPGKERKKKRGGEEHSPSIKMALLNLGKKERPHPPSLAEKRRRKGEDQNLPSSRLPALRSEKRLGRKKDSKGKGSTPFIFSS